MGTNYLMRRYNLVDKSLGSTGFDDESFQWLPCSIHIFSSSYPDQGSSRLIKWVHTSLSRTTFSDHCDEPSAVLRIHQIYNVSNNFQGNPNLKGHIRVDPDQRMNHLSGPFQHEGAAFGVQNELSLILWLHPLTFNPTNENASVCRAEGLCSGETV